MKTKFWILAAAMTVLALAIWGVLRARKEPAPGGEREQTVEVPSRVSQIEGLAAVTVDAAGQENSGIVVTAQQRTAHREEMQAIALVLSGQDLSALHAAYLAARAKVDADGATARTSQSEYQRLKRLHDDENHYVSDSILQAAESTWRVNEAALQSSQAALIALQQNADQQWGSVLAKAGFEGSGPYQRLINRQDALLQVVLPAGALLEEPPPQGRAQITATQSVTARLIAPAPRTDARLQGASYFYSAPAKGLLPGASLLVFLPMGSAMQGSTVPAAAIVWWQGRAWVYTQNSADRFVRRELSAGGSIDGGWFVPGGFANGEPVVTAGAQLLLSEELRSQITVSEEDRP